MKDELTRTIEEILDDYGWGINVAEYKAGQDEAVQKLVTLVNSEIIKELETLIGDEPSSGEVRVYQLQDRIKELSQ